MLKHASVFGLCIAAVAVLSAPVWSEQSTGRLTAQLAVTQSAGVQAKAFTFDFDPEVGLQIFHNDRQVNAVDSRKTGLNGFSALAIRGDQDRGRNQTIWLADLSVTLGGPVTVPAVIEADPYEEGAVAAEMKQLRPVIVYTEENAPARPKLEDLPLKGSVSQYGITWTFQTPARVGQFVNGDWYVVEPVTIEAIDPKPLYGSEIPRRELDSMDRQRKQAHRVRNGFMLNPPAKMEVAYDSGVRNWFTPSLIQKLPVTMNPGDSLISTISMPKNLVLGAQLRNKIERGVDDSSPIRTAAVLTCVGEPQPPDAFRPSFCDRQQRIYLARNLKRDLLPVVAATKSIPRVRQYIRFTQRPWVGTCFFGFEEPVENMPQYGLEYGRVVGISALLLCTDLKPQQKEPLLVNFVQVGIDLGGMVRAGHPGWTGWGGHGSGRKLPIVFAGLLLGDDELAGISLCYPKVSFGEDEQTAYGDCWTGARVVFAGHSGIDAATGEGRSRGSGWGPYEHTPPSQWQDGQNTSESYRRCCTSVGWVAQAMSLRLMQAEQAWGHNAFFDYVDRWMYEDDAAFVKTIKETTGRDHDKDWARQGQAWDAFVNEMWAKHRPTLQAPTDGWKEKHDDAYHDAAIAEQSGVPLGAAALGYTRCVINESPTASDIAPGDNGNHKWFSGQWYAKSPSLDHYSIQNDVLVLSLGGDLVSAPRDFSTGKLPLLPGSDGFYVEFDVRLSDNDPDHFPAVWLMPTEHNGKQEDQYVGDPAGFERWMELDIDEGGFGPGLTGTVHNWTGIYPNYQHVQNPNNVSSVPIDRTTKHTYGGSYDPVHESVTWWVDGVKQMSAGPPYVPAIAARQRFYLIISAQSHGKQRPYSMFVSGVRAYVPPSSLLPAWKSETRTNIPGNDALHPWSTNTHSADIAWSHVEEITPVMGAAMYVVDQAAPGAADTNPGTEEQPFKTVQHAADAAKPGDTVYVMTGKYDERVKVKAGGTEGKPVAFVAMPRRSVTVAGFDLEASYIRVEGFEITADKPVTAVQLRGSHCEILDNYIHDMMVAVNGTVGKPSADGNTRDYSAVTHNRIAYNKVYHSEYGFILGGEDWLVESNEVNRLFMYAPGNNYDDCDYTRFFGKGCIQRYNYYHGTDTKESKVAHVDCIQTFMNNGGMAQDLIFEYNTCFDWGQGCMVESAPHIGSVRNWTFRHNIYSSRLPTYKGAWGLNIIQTPDVTIENNTFVGITWFGVGLRGRESTNGQIRNNVFCHVQRAVIDGDSDFTPANPVVEYNLTFKTAPLAAGTNINGKDPLFVDPRKRDFCLKKGSPAIGAGKGGVTIGAIEYPSVYYVDPRHPAAVDELAWGYPAVPLASLAKACAIAQPGEMIMLRGGVYREVLAPKHDGVTIRAMRGEKVTISGADLIEGWKREVDGGWSASLATKPKKLLRDGQPWSEFSYDKAAKRIMVKSGGDPRLHVFETVLREQGINLVGKKGAKIEEITVVDTLKADAVNP